jgi:hypothetical protein
MPQRSLGFSPFPTVENGCGIQIDFLVEWAIERPHCRLGEPTGRARRAREHDQRWPFVGLSGLRKNLFPLALGASKHGGYKVAHLIGWRFCLGLARRRL